MVAAILADVRARGDAALLEYTARFDRVTLTAETMRVSADEIDRALASIEPGLLASLKLAAERIEDFHRRQTPDALSYTDAAGVRLGARWTAVGAVGLYVPGDRSLSKLRPDERAAGQGRRGGARDDGRADTGRQAQPAGAGRGPHRRGGRDLPDRRRPGGRCAGYGTETIRPVDKIVGPGNAYVAAAKRHVFGTVGIDMIAGPSEILVVADGANDPAWIAADLLSQAEHDTSAQSILITDDAAFAEAVKTAVEGHLKTLPRAEIAGASWRDHGAIIARVPSGRGGAAGRPAAPEHLELAVAEPDALAARIRNAGAIFLGRHTPEAIGDYIAGPNHVLPTARSARFSSGLNLLDFMKRTTLVGCDPGSLGAIGPAAVALAEAEGLGAHALSVSIRLNGAPR